MNVFTLAGSGLRNMYRELSGQKHSDPVSGDRVEITKEGAVRLRLEDPKVYRELQEAMKAVSKAAKKAGQEST